MNSQSRLASSAVDDAALMVRIRDRHPDALRLLYQRHAAPLLGLCLRIISDRTEAEQILVDVFWEIWERADRYDPARAAPSTYLTLLTRSRALDALRRRKATASGQADNHGGATMLGLDSTLASKVTAPLNHLLAGERSQSLRDALLSLDDDERSLIEACFYDGYTHAALAAKLQQPLGTVKTRIRRGLAQLRIKLHCAFDEPARDPARASETASDGQPEVR